MGCGASSTKVRYVVPPAPREKDESASVPRPLRAVGYRKGKEAVAAAGPPEAGSGSPAGRAAASAGAVGWAASTGQDSPVGRAAACGAARPEAETLSQQATRELSGAGLSEAGRSASSEAPPAHASSAGLPEGGVEWWGLHADWIRSRASEILAAYNFFFEHIGLRKGWRTAPFAREEVQAPFQAAAEVVTVVRARLDESAGRGLVLRQLEGSAMNFLWGWSPGRPPGSSAEALADFFRGLVFATLSDGQGLVEGLDSETVEYYVCCHPILAGSAVGTSPTAPTAVVSPGCSESAPVALVAPMPAEAA